MNWELAVAIGAATGLVALTLVVIALARQLRAMRGDLARLRSEVIHEPRSVEPRSVEPVETMTVEPVETPSVEPVETPSAAPSAIPFADLVLRETVIKSASVFHGLRRALDPEVRNRVRFAMRLEVRRARKQRRAERRQAYKAVTRAPAPSRLASRSTAEDAA